MVNLTLLFPAAIFGLSLFATAYATPVFGSSKTKSGTSAPAKPLPTISPSLANLGPTQKVLLYHVYYSEKELYAMYRKVQSPADVKSDDGPYDGPYDMFSIKEEALYWGNKYALGPGQKHQFLLATIEFTASKMCPVQTFPSADANWVNYAMNGNPPTPPTPQSAAAQPAPQPAIIEGPFAVETSITLTNFFKRPPAPQQQKSVFNDQPLWKYSIVDKACIDRLRIVKMERFHSDLTWSTKWNRVPGYFRNAAPDWHTYCPRCTLLPG